MKTYLLIGLIFWAVVSGLRSKTFEGASWTAVLSGILACVVLWPVALPYVLYLFATGK